MTVFWIATLLRPLAMAPAQRYTFISNTNKAQYLGNCKTIFEYLLSTYSPLLGVSTINYGFGITEYQHIYS